MAKCKFCGEEEKGKRHFLVQCHDNLFNECLSRRQFEAKALPILVVVKDGIYVPDSASLHTDCYMGTTVCAICGSYDDIHKENCLSKQAADLLAERGKG